MAASMSLRTKLILTAAVLTSALLLVVTVGVIATTRSDGHAPYSSKGRQGAVPSDAVPTPANQGADADIDAMRAMTPVEARTSSTLKAIAGPATSQVDLFAATFVTELLGINYADQTREQLLSWIQAESATTNEHDVVGLIPSSLRTRLAVYSLSTSTDGSSVPVPSPADWAGWKKRGASASVKIQKVMEPPEWTAAVQSGEIQDPGVTERQVDAEVTTRWRDGSAIKTTSESISITMNLEGPPTRGHYGFVTSVLYNEAAG